MPDGVQLELIDMSRVADWSYEFENTPLRMVRFTVLR